MRSSIFVMWLICGLSSLSHASTEPNATLVHGEAFNSAVLSVAFSPDGKLLASASRDSTVKVWNVTTRQVLATLPHRRRVDAVTFSPDGRLIATGSRVLRIWEVANWREVDSLEHPRNVRCVAFSSDGTILAAGTAGNKVHLWDVATRNKMATLTHGRYDQTLFSVAFSPDDSTLVSGSGDGDIRFWDVSTQKNTLIYSVYTSSVFSLAFSPDGVLLAASGISRDGNDWNSTVNLWNLETRLHTAKFDVRDPEYGYSWWIKSVAFSPDGKYIAAGAAQNTITFWDVGAQEKTAILGTSNTLTSGGRVGEVNSVAFSPDGKTLASGGAAEGPPRRGEIHLWDVSIETPTVPPSPGSNSDAVLSLDLIPDGGAGNRVNDGVTSGTVIGKDTKIAVEVFASGVKTSLAGLYVKFDFDSSVLTYVKAESDAFGFKIPQATGTYFAGTENVELPASGFLARGEFKTLVDVTNRSFSIGIDVVTLAESQTVSNDIRTTKVISFNSVAPPATFSISLDGNTAAGDQSVTTLGVGTGSVVPIQLFGIGIRDVNGISVRFEYDAAQVGYEGFDPGSLLPNAQVLAVPATNPTTIEISVVSFGGQATADSGMVGSVRFQTTDDFSATTLRLVRAEIGRGEQRESITPSDIAVTLRLSNPTPDFNGDGRVDFGDFVALGMHFGASRGDARYDAKYDLDQDGTIGFGDFLIFGQAFGT